MSGKGTTKFNIFPSRMNLANMRQRLKGAQRGRNLLRKKSDALSVRYLYADQFKICVFRSRSRSTHLDLTAS